MPISEHSIDDGTGRYGSRTRVNRFVYQFDIADLNGKTQVFSDIFPLNGEVHAIILDLSVTHMSSNTDADTVRGMFALLNAESLSWSMEFWNSCNVFFFIIIVFT